MRNVTERTLAVDTGAAKIIGINTEAIVKEASLLIENKNEYKKMIGKENPYGDGTASERIVKFLENRL